MPSAYELAIAEFARIDALELLASGERGHFVALVADVVRDYLERVVSPATTALTTVELAQVLQTESRVPAGRVLRVLQDVDLVKFAAAAIDADRAREIGTECRALVATVDDAMQAVATSRREAA